MAYKVPLFRIALVRERGVTLEIEEDRASQPSEVHRICKAMIKDSPKEHFILLMLNANNRIIGVTVLSIGTLTASLVHPREVYQPAILRSAASIVVAHNHPSGDPTPSAEDREATRRLAEAGRLLGVPLLDHGVIADKSWYSFKEHGLLE